MDLSEHTDFGREYYSTRAALRLALDRRLTLRAFTEAVEIGREEAIQRLVALHNDGTIAFAGSCPVVPDDVDPMDMVDDLVWRFNPPR